MNLVYLCLLNSPQGFYHHPREKGNYLSPPPPSLPPSLPPQAAGFLKIYFSAAERGEETFYLVGMTETFLSSFSKQL